jgi:formate hydrogenlyase subunit 3/multisubunit Na+/H+ antiporter MnhD subunit
MCPYVRTYSPIRELRARGFKVAVGDYFTTLGVFDSFALLFCTLTCFFVCICLWLGVRSFKEKYALLLLGMELCLLGCFLTVDLIVFYVCFELVSIILFIIILV